MPDFSLEDDFTGPVAGIDEVGRGPWAGPVVACAVVLDRASFPADLAAKLDDSKKLTERRRDALIEPLMDCAAVGLGEASVAEIDELNILQATFLAMHRALVALPVHPVAALVDGNKDPGLGLETRTVVKGDSRSLSIAAASVIAKVTRDRMMRDLSEAFPGYAWEKNAGYGTKAHQDGLAAHGVTPHHRRSFAPIARLIEEAG